MWSSGAKLLSLFHEQFDALHAAALACRSPSRLEKRICTARSAAVLLLTSALMGALLRLLQRRRR